MKSSEMTRIAAAMGALTLAGCAALPAPKQVSDLNFKDPAFAQCVDKYSETRLDQITLLDCKHSDISAVDEIRYMPKLTDLVLLNNKITQIDTRHNPELERLILGTNQISQIDLSGNPKLETLNISNNQLTALDVSHNPLLKSIYAYKMPLAEIDVSQQPELRDLGLSRHQLSWLDLRNNPKLKQLNISVGTLDNIDLSFNTKLQYLYLASNQFEELDLSHNRELRVLSVRNNQLTELALGNHPHLRQVKADYNALTSVDLSRSEMLQRLEVNNNKLTTIGLSQQPELKKLTAFNNPLQTLMLSDDADLKVLSVEGTPYESAQQQGSAGIAVQLSPRVSIVEGGVITREGNDYHVAASQLVTPSLGQYIGFRYAVTLPKDSSGRVTPELASQQSFPITVRMTHPEIVDPKTGKGTTVSTWTDTMFRHRNNLAMWYFGEQYELVSGRWELEILYRDQVVAKRAFKLVNMDDPAQSLANEQRKVMERFVTHGNDVLCSGEKFRGCFGFDSASSCKAELAPFKERCQISAASHLKRLMENGRKRESLGGAREFFSHFTVCVGSGYIRKEGLNPDTVEQCLSN